MLLQEVLKTFGGSVLFVVMNGKHLLRLVPKVLDARSVPMLNLEQNYPKANLQETVVSKIISPH